MMVALENLSHYRGTLGGKVVATNGCFDLFHPGHLDSLKRARRLGDHLIVGVNSDTSVRALKGDRRPLIPEAGRAEILNELKCVTAVVIFPQTNAVEFLRACKPTIWSKSSEYEGRVNVDEAAVLSEIGARICFQPTLEGYSTTEILKRPVFPPNGLVSAALV